VSGFPSLDSRSTFIARGFHLHSLPLLFRGVRLPNFYSLTAGFSLGVLAFWVAELGGQDRLAPAK
jgi:hypothetical protein